MFSPFDKMVIVSKIYGQPSYAAGARAGNIKLQSVTLSFRCTRDLGDWGWDWDGEMGGDLCGMYITGARAGYLSVPMVSYCKHSETDRMGVGW